MKELLSDSNKFAQESFIMSIFYSLVKELLPLKEYLDFFYNKKKPYKVVRDKALYQSHLVAKEELFDLKDASNMKRDPLMRNIGKTITNTILKEFYHQKKPTFHYLSSNKSLYS